jgi:predicted phosphodiesterase
VKTCIFSDIHGNGPAFREAFRMIAAEKADINIFLGDLCGYYFDQIEILLMIYDIPNLISIKGNHDNIFGQILKGDRELRNFYLGKYGQSMEKLLEERNDEIVQWLSALPESHFFSDLDMAGYHGSPWDKMDGYVYPDSTLDNFLDFSPSIFLLGHTHYPMAKEIGGKLVINPGSLGQPRNGGWPTYAVLDSSTKKVEFREVIYNKSELINRIDEIGDSTPYLRNVLEKKRQA